MTVAADHLVLAAATLIGLGAALATWRALAATGPLRGPLRRHLARIDADLRLLFSKTAAWEIAAVQLALALAALAAAVAWDLRLALLAPLGVAIPRHALAIARRRRVRELDEQLDGWLVVMGNMLRVTGSIADALQHTATLCRPPLGQELDLVLKELRVGVPLPDALRGMAARVRSSMLSTAVTILLLGRETGGELPRLLDEAAAAFRERLRLEAVVRKQTAMGRTQLAVLFVGPVAIVAMFHSVDPAYFAPLRSTSVGNVLTALAATMWITSIAIARRILAVDV